jgi:hypothetical protein
VAIRVPVRNNQRSSRGTPEGGQAKRLKAIGPPSYARDTQEDIRMAIGCDDYPEVQVSRENYINIQRAVGGLVNEIPEYGSTPQARRYVLDKRDCRCGMPRRRNQGLAG